MSTNFLNPRQAALAACAVLKSSIAARKSGGFATVPLLVGAPGVGKTSIARQMARVLGYEGLIVITPTMHTSLDLRGLPYVADNETRFAASQVLPKDKDAKFLILVDELADCPIHEQSGFYQLLLDRKMGEYTLPEGCDVIGATNDETHGACANPLSSAIKTRVCVINVKSDLEQSIKYALNNQWHPTVIGFMRFCGQELLDGFNPNDFAGGSTGRGLEQLSNVEKSEFPSDLTIGEAVAQGLIGSEYGTKYATYRMLDIPSVQDVFDNPAKADVPEKDTGKLFAYCSMIATSCDTPEKYRAVEKYAARLGRVDRIGLMADCARAFPNLKSTSTFATFAAENQDLIV